MIAVERPGPLTTVQDLGRPGYAHLGVPRAGAADAASLRRANALVGNPAQAAALETTLAGPVLVFDVPAVVALTGARSAPALDGVPVGFDEPIEVPAGGRLAVGTATAGLRGYLAVRGGIDVPPVLGSRSADTLSGLGPSPLRAGDRLPVGTLTVGTLPRAPAGPQPPAVDLGGAPVLRVSPGPHAAVEDPGCQSTRDPPQPGFPQLTALCGTAYAVTPASDRTGLRLAGRPLPAGVGVASLGLVPGAIQVPPDGQPILLLANHPPTGGYPVVAVVASTDLPVAAQLRPGATVRFSAI